MTAVDLPLEELRLRLAQILVQGQSAVGPDTVYRELIGFVPPCADARDAETLESKLRCMNEQVRLRGLSGANRGDEFLTALAEHEREHRIPGAVAAYG